MRKSHDPVHDTAIGHRIFIRICICPFDTVNQEPTVRESNSHLAIFF